jgi:hypothetical protein
VVVTVAALLGMLLASSPAQAGRGAPGAGSSVAAEPGWGNYRPLHATSSCMAVWNNEVVNTRRVHLWLCEYNNSAMRWTFVPADGGYYYIINYRLGPTGLNMCLDVPWPHQGQGTPLQVYQCTGGVNQQWRAELSSVHGYQILVNRGTGWLIDAANAGTGNGTPLVVWPHKSVPNQSWRYVD